MKLPCLKEALLQNGIYYTNVIIVVQCSPQYEHFAEIR